jgi:hypothetical protein
MRLKYDVIWKSKLPKLQGKEEEILDLHLNDKISVLQLSKMYKCDRKPIQNIIKKNGFDTRPSTSPELEGREDEIIRMYVDDQLTIQTIRKKIGCTFNSVKGFLKRNNIPLRSAEESRQTEDGKVKGTTRRLIDSKDLENAIKMYEKGEVLEKIGNKYDISPAGLRIKFLKHGVNLRTLTESANLPTTYERKKESYQEKYGVDNPMQHPKINETSNINRYKFKAVSIHGRRFSHLQGYEPQGIKYLIENDGIPVDEIQSGRKVPKIRYKFQGKNKMYFPDIYVESKNLLVEVKCKYTYENMLDLNKAKRDAAINAGYNFKTIIFTNNGKDILEVF